jgi:hypothetical protein
LGEGKDDHLCKLISVTPFLIYEKCGKASSFRSFYLKSSEGNESCPHHPPGYLRNTVSASLNTNKMVHEDTITPDLEKKDDLERPEENHVEILRKEQTQIEIDPQIDDRVTWKFDIHIIPWLFGIWYVFDSSSFARLKYISNKGRRLTYMFQKGYLHSLTEVMSEMPKLTD